MASAELIVPDRPLVAGVIQDMPVSGIAAQLITTGPPSPHPPCAQPFRLDGADPPKLS
jgi:hypothetical protein